MSGAQMTLEAPVAALPLVSVGLPVYNGERYLTQALESLCSQDYPNLEIIVSDNASTDGTSAICRMFAEKYPFIRIHRQSTNLGVQKNFQTALDLARGEYFMWAGVDDLWSPSFVQRLLRELQAYPKANLAMTAFERVYEDGRVHDVQRFSGKRSTNGRSALSTHLMATSPLKINLFLYGLFRTSFIREAAPYFPDIPCWDRVFMCMVSLATPIRCVDEVLHRHGLSSIPLKQRYPDEAIFKRKRAGDYRSFFWRTVGSICHTTLCSHVVPWPRKALLVIGIPHYIWEVAKHRTRRLAKAGRKRILEGLEHPMARASGLRAAAQFLDRRWKARVKKARRA